MIYIENFQEGQHIIGHYLCKDKQAMRPAPVKHTIMFYSWIKRALPWEKSGI